MHICLRIFLLFLLLKSYSCQKLWHSNFMGISDKPRNEFILKNVSLDQKFSLNGTVDYWRSLNSRYYSFAVGVSEGTIFLLNVTKTEDPRNFNISWKSKDVHETYRDGTLVDVPYKNEKHGGVFFVGISEDQKLRWINVKTLEHEWDWELGYQPDIIKFSFNNALNENQLFLTFQNTMYIYNLDVDKKELWLAQTLELPNPIGKFDTVAFKNRFYLLVPQKNIGQLLIYKFIDGKYQFFKDIRAEDIDQVVAFRINYKSFFAVNGLESGIYQFGQRNGIYREIIRDSHLEGIKYWLPVTVNNLRKNFILFAQRVLHHGSVKSLVIETFVYDGKQFEEHEDTPCQIFGEDFNTLNCLIAGDSAGIQDAGAVSAGNNLGLLIAKKGPNNLFRVTFEANELESPVRKMMKEVKNIKENLQKLIDEKLNNESADDSLFKVSPLRTAAADIVKTSASQLNAKPMQIIREKGAPIVGARNNADYARKLDILIDRLSQLHEKMDKVLAMEREGNFKKLIINGESRIERALVENTYSSLVNREIVDKILMDVVRKNQDMPVGGTKTFTDLNVKNLFFSSINGIKSENMLFQESDEIIIRGNVTFEKSVAIMNDVHADFINGLPSDSIPNINQHIYGSLSFDNLKVEKLKTQLVGAPSNLDKITKITPKSLVHLPLNVTVGKINGESVESFLKQICLVNIPNHMPGKIEIEGKIFFGEPSSIDHLNDEIFPDNYILTNQKEPVYVTGKKVFRRNLATNVLNTNDFHINEYLTGDYFTLSTTQRVTGNATFSKLDITEKFLHDGKTIGNQLKNQLPNPTLQESFNVSSSVNFETLEVLGSVIVEDMDGLNYGKILEDIVYKDEKKPSINSIKEFSEGLTIRNNLEITTESINRIVLDQIVTKDTPQSLNIPVLNGNVSISHMHVEKLINDVNITKLEQETVKTFGEQFISSFLIFEEPLIAENLEIKEALNEIPVENFYVTTGDRIFSQKPEFQDIEVENLSISKNVKGILSEMELNKFVDNRLTFSTPQTITESIKLVDSDTVEIDCQADTSLCTNIFDQNRLRNVLISKISSGDIPVKELIVKNDLKIEKIDGIPLSQVQEIKNKSSVIFGDVYFTDLQVSNLGGVPIREVLDDCVYKNETDVQINGLKAFQNGFVVKKLIETEAINYVPIENLMTMQGDQIVEAPLEIFGNAYFTNNLKVLQTINDVPIEGIKAYFQYKDDIFFIKGDITFKRLTYINNLDVFGRINGKDSKEVLSNIAYHGETLQFSDEVEFRGPVDIDGNIVIENNLNGIKLSKNNDKIVYMDRDTDNTIEGEVTFTADNVFAYHLTIETDLQTEWLSGLNVSVFRNNAIFLNQGLLHGSYHFRNITIHQKLITDSINQVDMSKVIPLRSDQDVDLLIIDNLMFLNNVSVNNSVNEMDLKTEYARSLLGNIADQEVKSEIYFRNNTLIRHNLEVAGLLNGHPINKIVTTDTNQTLRAAYNFHSKITMESNMYASGLINSINTSNWRNGTLKLVSKEPQVVRAPWHFVGNLTFEDTLDSQNGIYGFSMDQELHMMQEMKDHKTMMDLQYKKDSANICKDINALNKEFRTQTYKFENLEEILDFEYRRAIGRTHYFNVDKPSILVNGLGSCTSDLFHIENEILVLNNTFEMGEIDQIITVYDERDVFFVVKTKANSMCEEGTLLWQYKNEEMMKVQNINNQQLIQESLVPLTFYGLDKNGVTEFKVDMSKTIPVEAYRKWKVQEENTAFMPRGIGSGLAIRTGRKIIKLLRDEPFMDNEIAFETTAIKGTTKIFVNTVVPGRNNNKMAVLHVGPKGHGKTYLAVVYHEDAIVGRFDIVKIYEDYTENRIFQTISTYNPTQILSLEIENGETFLLILEDSQKLQIYRYTGVGGFRKFASANMNCTYMFKMLLPVGPSGQNMVSVVVINKNKLKILKPIMIGGLVKENIECS